MLSSRNWLYVLMCLGVKHLRCTKNDAGIWAMEGWMDGGVDMFRTSIEVLAVETGWCWVLAVQLFHILYVCLKGFLSAHISETWIFQKQAAPSLSAGSIMSRHLGSFWFVLASLACNLLFCFQPIGLLYIFSTSGPTQNILAISLDSLRIYHIRDRNHGKKEGFIWAQPSMAEKTRKWVWDGWSHWILRQNAETDKW